MNGSVLPHPLGLANSVREDCPTKLPQLEIEAAVGEGEWDGAQSVGGVFFVSINVDGVRESIEVRIQR